MVARGGDGGGTRERLDGERGCDVLGRTQRYAQLRSRLLLVHHEGLAIEEPLSEGGRGLDAG